MNNTSNKIAAVATEFYRVPLREALVDAGHGVHTHFDLVIARVKNGASEEGVGYTYTGGKGGGSIQSMIADDLALYVAGRDADDIDGLWQGMEADMHYVGRGGVLSFALSAVDIALWDLRLKQQGQPLSKAAGGHSDRTDCYAGFIDLNFPLDKLLGHVKDFQSRGFRGFKIKVGQSDWNDDVIRIRAVRDLIGPDAPFMIDANYSLSVDEAIRLAKSVEDQNITWFEEPILPDDFEGFARIGEATSIPLAMGENLHTLHEFERAISTSRLGYLQPDASNIGGITGWLKVAEMAKTAGMPICSHGMHELHVSLMASQAHAGSMEAHSFPIDEYTTHPLKLVDGQAVAPDQPGTGVEFEMELLKPHLVRQT